MYFTTAKTLAVVLALAGSVQPSVIPLTQRAPFYLGWHASTKEKIDEMKAADTMLFLGNSQPGKNQLGDGVYMSDKLGDWGSSGKVVCLFAADESKVRAASKVKYPEKNRAGKPIQWLWTNFENDAKKGKNIHAYFEDVGADLKTALRLSDWDNGLQLKIPETMVGESNPLGITIVECADFDKRNEMENKNVVVDWKSWPGWKGWLQSEPVPAGNEEAACLVNQKRDGSKAGSACALSSSTGTETGTATSTASSASMTSSSQAAATTSSSKAAATTSSKKAAATTSSSKAAATTSSKKAAATTSSKKAAATPDSKPKKPKGSKST
ncbi:hypothetical protein KVR01_000604 [Diaporthe batatas]|uniref:uncharacterized protein n=1 Tax=Diaporthe batatas TaxID=748121 RepID=UPI001D03E7C6|nr:uncharacterized protein KVR01_000604 [Diaporthe batatas]KAG8169859.1 hypothetical protein KVR01_000604 [Diaporthe batatas]